MYPICILSVDYILLQSTHRQPPPRSDMHVSDDIYAVLAVTDKQCNVSFGCFVTVDVDCHICTSLLCYTHAGYLCVSDPRRLTLTVRQGFQPAKYFSRYTLGTPTATPLVAADRAGFRQDAVRVLVAQLSI